MRSLAPVYLVLALLSSTAAAEEGGKMTQWTLWQETAFALVDTPAKAIELAEVIINCAYGREQLEAERPLSALDLGDRWEVRGTRLGSHAMPFFPVSSSITLLKKTGAIVDYSLSAPLPDNLRPPSAER